MGRKILVSNLVASHYIVAENMKYQNKKFCDSNREGFQFGSSEIVKLGEVNKILKKVSYYCHP
jgi:hypothetical protein